MALQVRKSHFAVRTNISLEKISPTSRMLSAITSINVPPNKAVWWERTPFARRGGDSSGWHPENSAHLRNCIAERVGVAARRMVLGKHSGRDALRARLEELGYTTSNTELPSATGW